MIPSSDYGSKSHQRTYKVKQHTSLRNGARLPWACKHCLRPTASEGICLKGRDVFIHHVMAGNRNHIFHQQTYTMITVENTALPSLLDKYTHILAYICIYEDVAINSTRPENWTSKSFFRDTQRSTPMLRKVQQMKENLLLTEVWESKVGQPSIVYI